MNDLITLAGAIAVQFRVFLSRSPKLLQRCLDLFFPIAEAVNAYYTLDARQIFISSLSWMMLVS